MTRNLKESFEGIINEDDWMEPVTKQKAIEKLRAVRGFIGYPEWIKNKTEIENFYSGVGINPLLFTNLAFI
jgi:predicted metalloendopeptidase